MRRIGLLVLVLASLSLTTAFAASFEVRAEDITSFSTPVSVSVPTTTTPPEPPRLVGTDPWYLYLEPPAPGGLSTKPQTGGPHKWQVDPTDSTIAAETDSTQYYVWSSGLLQPGIYFQNQRVTLNAYLTAGGNSIAAALLSCPGGAALSSTSPSPCTQIATGTGLGTQGNLVTVDLGFVTATVPTGHELRLKVVNTGTQFWQFEWGYKTNRESNLAIAAPLPPAPSP